MTHRGSTLALSLVALVARLAWGLSVRVPPVWDGELYERGARALATGLGYSCFLFGPAADPTVPTAFYPVGYPAFLGALYRVFGVSPSVVVVSGALLGAVTVALTHRLALRCAPPLAAHVAALAVALSPGAVVLSTTPMSETLWGALLTAAVFVLTRARLPRVETHGSQDEVRSADCSMPRTVTSPQRGLSLGCRGFQPAAAGRAELLLTAVLLAAAVYVRPQAVLLAPLLPALVSGTLRQRLARAAIVTVAVLALVAPWSVRNCRSLDGCAFVSTNGGSNLAIGAVPRATGQYLRLTADDGCRGVKGERTRERCWQSVAMASIRADPSRWLRLGWTKLHETWRHESYPAGYLRTARPDLVDARREQTLQRWMSRAWMSLWLIAFLGLIPLPSRRRMAPAATLSLGAIAAVMATHAVVFGGDRYHLPLVGLVAVLAASAFRESAGDLRSPAGVDPARR